MMSSAALRRQEIKGKYKAQQTDAPMYSRKKTLNIHFIKLIDILSSLLFEHSWYDYLLNSDSHLTLMAYGRPSKRVATNPKIK